MPEYRGWFRALVLLLLTGLAAAIRLHHLGAESFWLDEGTSYLIASQSWGELFRVLAEERANMALYLVILKLWLPFAHSDAGLRLLSVVFAALSVPAIDGLGRRLFNPAAGLLAALLLTLHGFHVRYSQEARAYSLLVLLAILTTWVFTRMLDDERPARSCALYVALMAVTVYSQFMGLFLMVGQLASLAAGGTREAWKRAVLAAVAVVALCTPLFYVMLRNDLDKIGWIGRPSIWNVMAFGFEISGRGHLPAAFFYSLLLGFGLWIAVRRKGEIALRRMLITAAFPFFLALGISLVGQPMFVPRYLLFLLPPFLLAIAYALSAVRPALLRTGFAVAMVVVSAPGVVHAWNEPREPWRGVAVPIIARGRATDALFVYQTLGSRPLGYYLDTSGHPVPRIIFPPADRMWQQNIQPAEADLAALEREDRVWLVFSRFRRPVQAERAAGIEKRMAVTHRLAGEWPVDGMRVMLWERR